MAPFSVQFRHPNARICGSKQLLEPESSNAIACDIIEAYLRIVIPIVSLDIIRGRDLVSDHYRIAKNVCELTVSRTDTGGQFLLAALLT